METTFMTIHNLSPKANILFASESIEDILDFQSPQVVGKSCFEFFHPDDLPFAKDVHERGLLLEKAAVIAYVRIKNKAGDWITCECVFSIVYDVLVACTSIYRLTGQSQRRQADAPIVQRKFSSPPRDPRYHMLQHLSVKFQAPPILGAREPRAALILNRFTRTLTVMYATNAATSILGVTPEQLQGKSFYECIEEGCLPDAIRCLENAKANDSIAYLRFWYRDPRRAVDLERTEREASNSSEDEDGGAPLHGKDTPASDSSARPALSPEARTNSSSDNSVTGDDSATPMFDKAHYAHEADSDTTQSSQQKTTNPSATDIQQDIEIEAVVSCTSDGLVVVLRRVKVLKSMFSRGADEPSTERGMFAAPWGVGPISSRSPLLANPSEKELRNPESMAATTAPTHNACNENLMDHIREVAVFAWSLVGINGSMATYATGKASGEASPRAGLPIWDPAAHHTSFEPPENQAYQKWTELYRRNDTPTNWPVGQGDVPYVHRRQELLLRQQFGYDGYEPMGSDHIGSSARSYLSHLIGSISCPNQPQDHIHATEQTPRQQRPKRPRPASFEERDVF